jgi:hypothetical protein
MRHRAAVWFLFESEKAFSSRVQRRVLTLTDSGSISASAKRVKLLLTSKR